MHVLQFLKKQGEGKLIAVRPGVECDEADFDFESD